jgi:allophanate hydrolase subunit 1
MKKKFTDAVTKNVTAVNTLQIKYAGESVTDESFGEKLRKLSTDYNSIFGV